MSNFQSLAQAFAEWREHFATNIDPNDCPALAESWNNYTDSLCKDGQLSPLQYHYAPAYDDDMPGTGSRFDPLSDDREFVLERMGVTLHAEFVPWSQSRNRAEKNPSLNWRVKLRYNGKDVTTTDYTQGSGHAPAYKIPQSYSNGKRDQWRTEIAVKAECETGRRCAVVSASGTPQGHGKPLSPPNVCDVLHSLLLDGCGAMDCRDFAEWCADYGLDSDSIKAKGMYDHCIATGLLLRNAFGGEKLDQLRELFEGM